jgi:hypothetical protein
MGGLGIAEQFKLTAEKSNESGTPLAKSNGGSQPIVDPNADATRIFADTLSQIIKKSEPQDPAKEITPFEKGMIGDDGLREGVVAMKALAGEKRQGRV